MLDSPERRYTLAQTVTASLSVPLQEESEFSRDIGQWPIWEGKI